MGVAPTKTAGFGALAVLVVDDDAATRSLIARMLVNMGVKFVQQAANGNDALTLIRSQRPHVVICDIEMEPMSGLAVLKSLRTSSLANERSLPFVFLTRHSDAPLVSAARQQACNGFLIKPVSPDRLRDTVAKVTGS